MNVDNRDAKGLFIYNCNRLIIMFEPVEEPPHDFRGIVGIVNVPYFLSSPTHNKQDFAMESEKRAIVNALKTHIKHYSKYINAMDFDWKNFGYKTKYCNTPEKDEQYRQFRYKNHKILKQCRNCLVWRELVYKRNFMESTYVRNDWTCCDGFQ